MKKIKNSEVLSKVEIFGVSYKLEIAYKYVKIPKITKEEKIIKIILPFKYKKVDNKLIVDMLIKKMYDSIAEKELDSIMEKVRITLKFAPQDFEISRINNTLGKCYKDKVIINPDIVKYKKETIEYIIFHEFCYFKCKKHSQKFYDMIKSYVPNYKTYAYEVAGMNY